MNNIELENIKVKMNDEDVSGKDIDDLIKELEQEDVEVIKFVDNNGSESIIKKPSFLTRLKHKWRAMEQSLYFMCFQKHINASQAMKCRFQTLAGIEKNTSLATITIGNETFNLSELPSWDTVLRFKLCGIKYKVLYKC